MTLRFPAHALLIFLTFVSQLNAEEPILFSKHVAPILQAQCVGCHGPETAEADYRLDTYAHLLSSANDEAIVTAKDLQDSALYQRLIAADPEVRMPADADPLPQEQVDAIKSWIMLGARFDGDSVNTPLAELSPAVIHPSPPEHYSTPLPLSALAWSRDRRRILTSGYHEITVWNFQGELVRRIQNQGERTYSVQLHPEMPWILASSGMPGELGEVRIFHEQDGSLVGVVTKADETILASRFSPDGKRIAVGLADGSLRVFSADTFELELVLLGHSDQITDLAWHPDNQRLATASRDKTAKIFDVKKAKAVSTFTGHTESVNAISFLNDQELVSAGEDGQLLTWNAKDGKKLADLVKAREHFLSVVVGTSVMTATSSGHTYRFERESMRQLERVENGKDWAPVAAMDAASDSTVVGFQSARVVIYDTEGKRQAEFVAKP